MTPRERTQSLCNGMFTGHADLYSEEIEQAIISAIAEEREACAKVADARAEVCRDAMTGPPGSLPGVEVHTMNEALHIAGLIRARTTMKD